MHALTLDNLLAATGGSAVGGGVEIGGAEVGRVGFDHVAFHRVQTDSRQVRPGDVFWAVRGRRLDGHNFLADAARNGAGICVIEQQRAGDLPLGTAAVLVDDTTAALGRFARRRRQQWGGRVIGVTGSFGKTTTREMIHAVLSAGFAGMRSPENYNNEFGVPRTLLEMQPAHRYAVVEMAAAAPGEIMKLADIAKPDIGVITGVGPAHLDGFGDLRTVLETKSELMRSLPAGGLLVLAGDDPRLRRVAGQAGCRTVLVGEGIHKIHNTVRATAVRQTDRELEFEVGNEVYRVPASGRHHLTAALAALAVGREFGLTAEEIRAGLKTFRPMHGRCEVLRIGPWTVIDDTYNANPVSMQAACRLLRDWQGQPGRRHQKHLVVGDMLELGEHAAAYHRHLGRQVAVSLIDYLFAVGPLAQETIAGAVEEGMDPDRAIACDTLETLETLETLAGQLGRRLESGDVILVKGSRSTRMERVIEWLRQHADEQSEQPTADMAKRRAA